ncbi:MAG: nucleotide exchange factor GrpE [Limisphaerales bacterium]
MSDDRQPARLAKWPFYLADLLLSAVIFFVLYQLGTFEGTTDMVIVAVCIAAAAVAAWISVLPWLKEHDASVKISDSSNLKSSLEQIRSVEKIADLIRQSNAQWQGVQEASGRTVASAREITDKMKLEADEFMKFIANAHDQERAGLRLEVEKLRRMEADWIKVAVQMLDHVFALARAAERSGQQQIIKQLQQFQNACRDVARRMGLASFVPALGEPFDQRAHQLPNPQMTTKEGDTIQDVLASGFTYQGQLLRRSLVLLESSPAEVHQDTPVAEESVPEPEVQSSSTRPGEPDPAAESIIQESTTPGSMEDPVTEQSREVPVPTPMFKDSNEEVPVFKESLDEEQVFRPEAPPQAPEPPPGEPSPRPARVRKRAGQEELPL